MKKILSYVAVFSLVVAASSCSLEKFPETMYAENNTSGTGDAETAINTRELLEGQLTAMYNYMKGDFQNYWYQLIVLAESRADNAYGCPGETKTMAVEQNQLDSDNEFAATMWNYSMNAVDYANQVICNIDLVKENDPSLTEKEYQEWLSEALCWRAYIWINMMQMFGEIPMLTEIPPAINADNIEEVYPLYFPSRVSKETVGEQIVKDIEEYACKYAPDMDASNKFKITKGFAYGLMARFYSMREFRDWSKVVSACEAVEGMGYSLCDKYGDLWAYTTGDTGMAAMNTRESIFEVQWTSQTSGSWMWMMFHRNAYVPGDSFSWAKWCTPSRNLTKAYDAEGDTERKNASVVYDECGWSYHYPSDEYAFMHKFPTNVTPVYLMRLAEIRLLHAEALANTDDPGGAADIVDEIRGRAGIGKLTAAQRASADLMREAVLHERRLELAMEGFRWFDLMRYGDDYSKLFEICDGVNIKGSASYDSYFQTRRAMNDNRVLMPVPTSVLEDNTNIEQNLGY